MRTEKKLWELVLSRQDLFKTGLCEWVGACFRCGVITLEEREFLVIKGLSTLPSYPVGYFCWPRREIAPRIEWIKNRIKQL